MEEYQPTIPKYKIKELPDVFGEDSDTLRVMRGIVLLVAQRVERALKIASQPSFGLEAAMELVESLFDKGLIVFHVSDTFSVSALFWDKLDGTYKLPHLLSKGGLEEYFGVDGNDNSEPS